MNEAERLVADYAGMGLSVGRHPMALRRDELAMRGILRARDLPVARPGRRVRVAGMVITRQRPGTAKGFVLLTLEDETGIANIIVRPDLFARDRLVIIEEPVPDRRRRAAEPGRRQVDPRRTGAGDERRGYRLRRSRLLLADLPVISIPARMPTP
jgi:DNA polymerase III alpha subunit